MAGAVTEYQMKGSFLLESFGFLQRCLVGNIADPGCNSFDLNLDGAVNLLDYDELFECWMSP